MTIHRSGKKCYVKNVGKNYQSMIQGIMDCVNPVINIIVMVGQITRCHKKDVLHMISEGMSFAMFVAGHIGDLVAM